jgi:hypothetical protein
MSIYCLSIYCIDISKHSVSGSTISFGSTDATQLSYHDNDDFFNIQMYNTTHEGYLLLTT